jgi:hypothetical protein
MKMVGKPDAGNPHVRFDEGGGPLGPSLLYEWDFVRVLRYRYVSPNNGEVVDVCC